MGSRAHPSNRDLATRESKSDYTGTSAGDPGLNRVVIGREPGWIEMDEFGPGVEKRST